MGSIFHRVLLRLLDRIVAMLLLFHFPQGMQRAAVQLMRGGHFVLGKKRHKSGIAR